LLDAVSQRDPSYAILLTRNGSSEAPRRVTLVKVVARKVEQVPLKSE
jgi:hypothetical protein